MSLAKQDMFLLKEDVLIQEPNEPNNLQICCTDRSEILGHIGFVPHRLSPIPVKVLKKQGLIDICCCCCCDT
jgi:hypothetical protein